MILCCGEALIDFIPRSLSDGSEAYLPVPGGAVYNTAVALGRLGEEVGFFSGISTDPFGQKLISYLESSGVMTAFCRRSPGPTTLALVTMKNGTAQYNFYDEKSAGRMLDIETLPNISDEVTALHFGAISLIHEPCGSAFEEFMRRMHSTNVISFDPNIRPKFITDEASYRERLRRMIAMSDIIKVSEEDMAWLEPGSSFEHIANNWIENGAVVVTLTMGERGARSLTKKLDVTCPATPVSVVDTVGAGDTFNAGFLSSLRSNKVLTKEDLKTIGPNALKSALEYGAKVAAYTVGQTGAKPPWRDELAS